MPAPYDLLIADAHVVTAAGDPLPSTSIGIRDGRISALLPAGSPPEKRRATRTIDASRAAVIPGFVDPHTHVASNLLLRGLNEDTELFAWLATMWRLKKNFDHETLYWASMCGLVEMARSGITCFNEHFDAYAVTPQVRALTEVPLRATLGYGFADEGVYADVAGWSWAAVEDWDAATAGARAVPGGVNGDRVRLALSPHAPYSASEDLWRAVRRLADDRGLTIHTHLAEGANEVAFVRERYGRTTTEWLDDIGFLGPDITAAHCTQLTASDIALFAAHGVKVAHCPICNAKIVSGTMDLRALWEAGVEVGLATDGPASHNTMDMFQEMKFAAITHKQATGDPTFLTTREVLAMATRGSAAAMHRPELGRIEVGAPADLVLVDLDRPHLQPVYDVEAALVYSARADDVVATIVGGRVVYGDGEVTGVDTERVVARFREAAYALRARSV